VPYVQREVNGQTLKPVSLSSSTGWVALITGEQRGRPIVAWALMADGEVVGLVFEGGFLVSAEQVLNFQGFKHNG
jgi:hypothetical protein